MGRFSHGTTKNTVFLRQGFSTLRAADNVRPIRSKKAA
jgi:hypothetical protein